MQERTPLVVPEAPPTDTSGYLACYPACALDPNAAFPNADAYNKSYEIVGNGLLLADGVIGLGRWALGRLGIGVARGLLPAARYAARGFAEGQLEIHFSKHAAEWGAGNITKAGYLKRAQSLLGRDVGGDILGAVRANGDILRYNAATNEFAVGAADGTIRTLFRPSDGMAYWLKQVAP